MHNLALVLAQRIAGRDLDHARVDPGRADAVLDLVEVVLRDLLFPALPPVVGDADGVMLHVEAGRADQLHAGALRNLGEQLGIASELDRARIDERADARVE